MKTLYRNLISPATTGLVLFLFSAVLLAPVRSQAQGGVCSTISFSLENYQNCCYRLHIDNSTECVPQLILQIDGGTFSSWNVIPLAGYTGMLLGPGELKLTHSNGFIPLGASTAVQFCVPAGTNTTLTILYDYTCGLGKGCVATLPLTGCQAIANSCISGVKYRECGVSAYTNQPLMPGWEITLTDIDGNVIGTDVTDNTGAYEFCDLPPGNYIVRETQQPGWTPKVPATGQYSVSLAQSQMLTRNFGNCPGCSCDSISPLVVREPGVSDTSRYHLALFVQDAFCFSYVQIDVGGVGVFLDWQTLLPGWTVQQQSATSIRLLPPATQLAGGAFYPLDFQTVGAGAQEISITTVYNTGSGNQSCVVVTPFPWPPLPIAETCCPANTTPGPNLVTNGDFETGPTGLTGFTSDYLLSTSCSPGRYNVRTGPQLPGMCSEWGGFDHTYQNASGRMLAADGSQTLGQAAWRAALTLTPNTQYTFCAYVNNLNVPTRPDNDPIVQAWLVPSNAAPILLDATLPTLAEVPNAWIKLSATYSTTGTVAPSYNLEFRTASQAFTGNNFAVDDIVFRACTPPPPCAGTLNITQLPGCQAQVSATMTGTGPYTYQWCTGETTPVVLQPIPCTPQMYCVTVFCADGSSVDLSIINPFVDNIPPTAVCVPGFGVILNANCQYAVTAAAIDGGSTDNCMIQSMTVSPALITGCGNTTVTLTVTDKCGNTSTCTTGIQTIETTPPVITNCPTSQNVGTSPGVCFYNYTPPNLTATDNCAPPPTVACTWEDPNGTILPVTPGALQLPKGTSTFRCIATDGCGNESALCQYTITVSDLEPPTLMCPPDITVQGTPGPTGQCEAVVNGIPPTASDNCVMLNIDYTITGGTTATGQTDASGTLFSGTSTVTYTVMDMGGNTKTCSFTVTVKCPPVVNSWCGKAVVTYFRQQTGLPGGIFYDARFNSTAPAGADWATVPEVHPPNWSPASIGNIFGIALDGGNGDIYLAATDVYNYDYALFFGTFPTLAGPAGRSGIYKANANNLPANPFTTTVNAGSLASYNSGSALPNGGGAGNGIGNIAWDGQQLFATNLEDGRIYRISAGGTLLSAYDPFGLDNGAPGIAPLGERIWGIGVYGGRVYFAREQSGGNPKQIWSIGLTGTGEFASTPQGNGLFAGPAVLEISPGPGTQMKYTDIEFAADGRMLFAERGHPHDAQVYEYHKPSTTWVSTAVPHFVGANPGKNAAGGVDYGYKELAANPTALCDALTWSTGNCMNVAAIPGLSCEVYGIQGTDAAVGNTVAGSPASDLFIDFNHTYGADLKMQIGDVDFFRCGCPGPGSMCDSISVTSMPFNGPQDTCCFKLTVNNQKPNFFSAIQLCAQNGVSFSNVMAQNGWTIGGYTAAMVSVLPPGGQSVPVGSFDFVKFCLSNYQTVPNQQIIVKYYDQNFEVVCYDTLNYNCSQKPKCLKLTPTVTCGPAGTGTYIMNFCVMSDPLIAFNVQTVVLNAPPGITFTPNTFVLNPALPPGQMQCNFTTVISGAVDGQTFCFSATAHQQAMPPYLMCCTDTVMLACVTMPDCVCNHVSASAMPVTLPGDDCCWKVNLTNNYSNTYFTGIQLEILTGGVVFGAIANFPGSGWSMASNPTQATFTKINPGGVFIGTTAMLPTFCLAGILNASQVPQIVVVRWLGPNGQVVCTDTLTLDCPPPVISDCAVIVNPQLVCDPGNPGVYLFSFQVMNNSNFPINLISLNNVVLPAVATPTVFAIPTLQPGQTSGVLTTQIVGLIAGQQFCFHLTIHEIAANGSELNCCTHSQQYCFTMPPCPSGCACGAFSELFVRPTPGAASIPITCGQSLGFIGCPPAGASLPFTGKFECMGAACPQTTTINWTLTGPGGVHMGTVQATPYFYLPIPPAYYSTPGTYTLILQGSCGGVPCPPCEFSFAVDCPQPCPCDPTDFQADLNKGFAFTKNNCKVCFTPLALGECDDVQWTVNGVAIGQSTGNKTFCHTFPGSGTYTVTMFVIRRKADGTICSEGSWSKTITLNCLAIDNCTASVFDNPTFAEGAIGGGLNTTGASTGWYGPCGEPFVVEGAAGSLDAWVMELSGNLDSADVLATILPVCVVQDSGTITMRFGIKENGIKSTLTIQVYQGADFEMNECDGVSCITLANIDLEPLDSGWLELTLPYSLLGWNALEPCGSPETGIPIRPAIFVTTALGSNQPGALKTRIQIDNFCMGGQLVSAFTPPGLLPLRVFPNPNAGTFTVELPAAAEPDLQLRLIGITGRTLLEQAAEPGRARQIVAADILPAGLYFVQVLRGGQVIGVEKVVKQ